MRATTSTHPLRDNARVLFASMVGTAVEYYDFYLYAYAAALVFGPLFFPVQSPAAQTLLSLMSFGIAFFARPVGAVAFGHFGDRIGRKSTLVASMLLMGGCTFAIAFVPTYAMVGWVGPTLLCLLRFGQGFGLGGEWAGAALLSVENAPEGWQVRFGAMPGLGSLIGNIAATAMFLLMGFSLSAADFAEWGWRLPFLASAALVLIGLWVRLKLTETPEFRAALQREPPPRVPVVRLFAEHKGAVLAGCAAVITPFALVYMAGPYALAQATGPLGFDRQTFLLVQLVALLLAVPTVLLAARLADQTSLMRVIIPGVVATVPLGCFFGLGLGSGSLLIAGATVAVANLLWAVTTGTVSTWLSQLFPVRVRYSGFAFAFNTGGIAGAILPIPAQMMSSAGAGNYVGLLLAAAGLLTLAGLLLGRPIGIRPRAAFMKPA
jgi:MFS transporter